MKRRVRKTKNAAEKIIFFNSDHSLSYSSFLLFSLSPLLFFPPPPSFFFSSFILMSLRHLKHHESKLLKKVDFLQWKSEENVREVKILRRYHIQRREDYLKYNRIVGFITKITHRLKKLDPRDPIRIKITQNLLEKL